MHPRLFHQNNLGYRYLFLSFQVGIVIQSHAKGKGANFDRTWDEYKVSFGTIEENNFWIGLEKMHTLTHSGIYGVRIDLKMNDGTFKTAEFESFAVMDIYDNYRLHISGFKSASGLTDRFSYHNNKQFSTKDADNDSDPNDNCAANYGNTGWWFGQCFNVHLNQIDGPTLNDRPDPSTGQWTRELESKMTLIKSQSKLIFYRLIQIINYLFQFNDLFSIQ